MTFISARNYNDFAYVTHAGFLTYVGDPPGDRLKNKFLPYIYIYIYIGNIYIYIYIYTCICIYIYIYRERERERERDRDSERERERARETETQRDRATGRQRDRLTKQRGSYSKVLAVHHTQMNETGARCANTPEGNAPEIAFSIVIVENN